MLINIPLLSFGFEASDHNKRDVDLHRTILVVHLSHHLFLATPIVLHDEKDGNDSDCVIVEPSVSSEKAITPEDEESSVEFFRLEPNHSNDSIIVSDETEELDSEDPLAAISDQSVPSRKMLINNEVHDAIGLTSHVNCLFTAIKQSDVTMNAVNRHHKLI